MTGINTAGEAVPILLCVLQEAANDAVHRGPLEIGRVMQSHGVKSRTLGVVKLTPEEAKVRIGGLGELGQLNLDIDLFVLNSASALNAEDMNVKLLEKLSSQ